MGRPGDESERTRAISTLLYVLGGWVVLSLLTYALLRPLVATSSRSERGRVDEPPPRAPPAVPRSEGVSSPQRAGYSGMALERLAHHARTVLGFENAWIVVAEPSGRGHSALVAASSDPELIGQRVPAAYGSIELEACASATVTAAPGARCALGVGGPNERRELDPHEVELLWEMAELGAEAIRHHDRRALMLGDSGAEIRALVQALAEAEGESYAAAQAVAATAREVGEELFLPRPDLVEVELGTLLRDVGKLRLPRSLLRQAGPLNDHDRQLMRLHPVWSAEMIAHIPGMEAVALIVRLHHERADGVGYPHELHLERTPMASRIVGVCDAYAAMTRSRSYSDSVSVEEALEELDLHAGKQFDPAVVDALAAVVRSPAAVPA